MKKQISPRKVSILNFYRPLQALTLKGKNPKLVENYDESSREIQYFFYLFSINVHTRETCAILKHVDKKTLKIVSQQVVIFFPRKKLRMPPSMERRHKGMAGEYFIAQMTKHRET